MTPARYELLHVLGRGGMGSVYAAIHHPSGRRVAVKIPQLSATGPEQRALLREAVAAARLRDPRIVSLLDAVRLDDCRLALVMELVDGVNLSLWARSWPGWRPTLEVLDDVLAGLCAAHAAGIVHRDLKPENVLVSHEGRGKIADFGIAADLDLRSAQEDNRFIGGTPVYMAPEQFQIDGHIGPWTDLYAFGVIIFAVVAGAPPFHDKRLGELVLKKSQGQPADALDPVLVPEPVRDLIRRLLDPDVRRRPRFARDVRTELASWNTQGWGVPRAACDGVTQTPSRQSTPKSPLGASLAELGAASTVPSDSSHSAPVPEPAPDGQPADPTILPAPLDPDLGVTLARIREPALVGRTGEREAIVRCWGDVLRTGRPRLLGLVGASGVGKSTLARWGLGKVEAGAMMEPLAAAYGVSGSESSHGLRHALSRLLGSVDVRTASAGWPESWRWLVSASTPPFNASLVARWLGGDAPLDEPAQAAELAYQVLLVASRVRPIYLWLDDLGWAHDGGIELAARLLERAEAAVLVVATFRTGTLAHQAVRETAERLFSLPGATLRQMPNLAADERAELIGKVAPVDPSFAQTLAEHLDETTLTIIELVHDWIGAGLLRPGEHGFSPARDLAHMLRERPPSVALLHRVSSWFDIFGAAAGTAETVLIRAALLGLVFDELTLVAACASFDETAKVVHTVLDRALLSGILRPEGRDGYRFDHSAIREVLLARLDARADRNEQLRDTAEGVLDRIGAARPELCALAAGWLRRVDPADHKSWTSMIDAGQAMALASAQMKAANIALTLQQWLEQDHVPEFDWRRAATALSHAKMLFLASRYQEAEQELGEARRISRSLGDPAFELRCDFLHAQILLYSDRLREAEEIFENIARDPKAGRDPQTHAGVHHSLAELASLRQDHEEALHHSEQALSATERHLAPNRVRMLMIQIADRLITLGRPEEAQHWLDSVEAQIHEAGDRSVTTELDETRFRWLANQNAWSELRSRGLERHAREVATLGDAWRLTAVRLLQALTAEALDGAPRVAAAAERFATAFGRAHHDESFTRQHMLLLAARLEARGLGDLAVRIRGLHAARQAAIERGFAERAGAVDSSAG